VKVKNSVVHSLFVRVKNSVVHSLFVGVKNSVVHSPFVEVKYSVVHQRFVRLRILYNRNIFLSAAMKVIDISTVQLHFQIYETNQVKSRKV
jgi:hypothetical protein